MDALAAGLGVTEHAPSGKAAAEIRALLSWLLAQLERPQRGRRDEAPAREARG
jgi:hypothetical protein